MTGTENRRLLAHLMRRAGCGATSSELDELSKIFAGKHSAQKGADNIAAAWEKLTDQIGRNKQLQLYRASLGLS